MKPNVDRFNLDRWILKLLDYWERDTNGVCNLVVNLQIELLGISKSRIWKEKPTRKSSGIILPSHYCSKRSTNDMCNVLKSTSMPFRWWKRKLSFIRFNIIDIIDISLSDCIPLVIDLDTLDICTKYFISPYIVVCTVPSPIIPHKSGVRS